MIRKFSNYLSYFEGAKILINRYTIVENLRNFVSPYNSSLPYFFGRKFNITNFVFFSGGAGKQSGCRWSSMLIICFSGYILSREALRRVFELGLSKQKCQGSAKEYFEDVNMSMQISTMIQALNFEAFQTWTGKCVREVNGIFGNTTDQVGRQRFMPYRLNDFYSGEGIYIGFMQNSGIEHQLVITIWFFRKMIAIYLLLGLRVLFQPTHYVPLHLWLWDANVRVPCVQTDRCKRVQDSLTTVDWKVCTPK